MIIIWILASLGFAQESPSEILSEQVILNEIEPEASFSYLYVMEQTRSIQIKGLEGPLRVLINDQDLLSPVSFQDSDIPDPEEVAQEIFRFLSQNFVVWTVPEQTTREASLFGYGFGLCHLESRVLTALWWEHGVTGRLIGWDRHTMAEALIRDNWHAFDAQHQTDFSQIWAKPTSFDDLKNGGAFPQPGLDPIGYDHEVMQRWYAEAEPYRINQENIIQRPLQNLTPDQELLIERRTTDSPLSLPVEPAPRDRLRDHLIPGYVLTLWQESNGDPITLDTRLPILGISGHAVDLGCAQVNGETVDINNLKGVCMPVTFELPAGTVLEVHYALAAWVGDRLFQPETLIAIENRSEDAVLFEYSPKEPESFSLEDLVVEPPQAGSNLWTFNYTISWKNLASDLPINYQFFFTELSSELPVEAWRYVSDWVWTWDPLELPSSGSQRMAVTFQPQNREEGAPRRPSNHRTLLLHVKGPNAIAGRTQLQANIELNP